MATRGVTLAYRAFSVATLQGMLVNWQQCLATIATAGKSYTIGPRTFTQANVGEIETAIGEIQAAIDFKNNVRVKNVLWDGSNRRPL